MSEYWKAIIAPAFLELGDLDVDFRVGSQSIKVHKKVLEKSSPVLKAKLSDVWKTSGDVLQLDEEYVEPEVVEELLECLYCMYEDKKPACTIENAYSLCIAADYLMISKLVTSCCDKLRNNITRKNLYDLYVLSNHLNLSALREACENFIIGLPDFNSDYLLKPQVVKLTAESLKKFIEKLLRYDWNPQLRENILSSLTIWAEDSLEDRSRKVESLLEFVPPEAVSSDRLLRFMQTELYSKLSESRRKQYSIRPYLSECSCSIDKLYFVSWKPFIAWSGYLDCLDLSAEGKSWQVGPKKERNEKPILVVSWGKNVYFFGSRKFGPMNVFSSDTGESLFELKKPLDGHYRKILAGAGLGNHIYITVSFKPLDLLAGKFLANRELPGRSVEQFSLKTKQWETLEDMQTARLAHQLVALDSFIYAIGGEVSEPKTTNSYVKGETDRVPGPERYDSRADRWEYIAPSNYHHELPGAVAHEGQIYVLSQAGFEAYSPETDKWTQLPAPIVCRVPSLVSIAGRLWLITQPNAPVSWTPERSRFVYEFDVVKQEWTRLPDFEGRDSDHVFAFVIKN